MKSVTIINDTNETSQISPSKIVCVGRNYVEHITELNNETPDTMVVFNKPNSAIGKELNSIHNEPLHFEAEICFMIKNGQYAYVAAGLDLTKRALQTKLKKQGLPWERSKAFSDSALFSDFVPLSSITDDLTIELSIDSELQQQGDVSFMIYKPDAILQDIQSFMDLNDGDIIMTGTPKGVGMVEKGKNYTIRVLQNNNILTSIKFTAL